MVETIETYTTCLPDGSRKSKANRYNLRSFSRRKAEATKYSSKEDLKKPLQETAKVASNKLLSNSLSCPELCGKMTSTATGNPRVEPKEPALAMGFVNMASDNFETDESSGEGSSTFERSISDSEINYFPLGESSGEQNSGKWGCGFLPNKGRHLTS